MTIDISNLSQEKRVFLKANPEFSKKLEEEAVKSVRGFMNRKVKAEKGESKDFDTLYEKYMKQVEEEFPMFMRDAFLRDLNEKLSIPDMVASKYVCPVCGDSDKGNTMNGKPYCTKCECPLVEKKHLQRWLKGFKQIKVVSERDFWRRSLNGAGC